MVEGFGEPCSPRLGELPKSERDLSASPLEPEHLCVRHELGSSLTRGPNSPSSKGATGVGRKGAVAVLFPFRFSSQGPSYERGRSRVGAVLKTVKDNERVPG